MKRKFTKFASSIVCLILCFGATACGGGGATSDSTGGSTGKYNLPGKNKTTINYRSFTGGVGSAWLDELAEEFAKEHAETSFGNGKTGVYINIEKNMSTTASDLSSSNYHILNLERYNFPGDIAQGGELYNLNDIVKDTSREGGTLEDAIFSNYKGLLKDYQGNYVALPNYEFYSGLSYNYKVFDEISAFFAEETDADAFEFESTYSEHTFYFTNASGEKRCGPDGEKGTEDDGLPESMEELIVLMDYIKTESGGYKPVTLSGAYTNYINYLTAGLWGALAGQTQMQNYYNSSGKIDIVEIEGNGRVVSAGGSLFKGIDYITKPNIIETTLDDTNGFVGNDMAAKYYALAMVEIMQKEGFFANEVSQGSVTHYGAQDAFLQGKNASYDNSAMLIEASYWYNEMEDSGGLDRYQFSTGNSGDDLDIRFMCLPNKFYADEVKEPQPSSLMDVGQCFTIVNNNITRAGNEDVEAAVVALMKFIYTEKNLQFFTAKTGVPRAIKYDLTQEQYNGLSSFYQHLYDLRKADGSNVVYASGTTNAYKLNKSSMYIHLDGTPVRSALYTHIKNQGAEVCFLSSRFSSSNWQR